MRLRPLALLALTVLVSLSAFSTASAAGVEWHRNLRDAAAQSEKSGKPILLQFTASWCGYCHKMLRETFTEKEIAAQINKCFVPVVLDADDNEAVVDAVGVEAFPTTVIISPELDVIGRIQGFYQAPQFAQKLAPYCRKSQTVAQTAVLKGDAPPVARPVSAEKAAPSVAFGGLCLVSMLDDRKMLKGDAKITHETHGVLLQFSSEEHLKTFLAKPERYWPTADGHCPVATVNGEKDTVGDPATTAVYHDQLLIFHDLDHRAEFAKHPQEFMQKLTAVLAERDSETELK